MDGEDAGPSPAVVPHAGEASATAGLLSCCDRLDPLRIRGVEHMESRMHTQTQIKLPMTPAEIALLVKVYREAMEWSQETLANSRADAADHSARRSQATVEPQRGMITITIGWSSRWR